MLKVSRLADYALLAMCQIVVAGDIYHSAGYLAERTGVPIATMRKILKQLCRAGLLHSRQGVSGGYRLTAAPAAITVAQVLEAIDGDFSMTYCQDARQSCHLYQGCSLRRPWDIIRQKMHAVLSAYSLQHLVAPMSDAMWLGACSTPQDQSTNMSDF